MTALLAPAPAAGDTVTIGSKLDKPWDGNTFNCDPCIRFQFTQPTNSLPLVAPNAATITSWAIRTSGGGELFTLRTMRRTRGPDTAPQYSFHGTAVAPAVIPLGTMDDVIRYQASLPIAQGDGIGFASTGGVVPRAPIPVAGAAATFVPNPPADGGPSAAALDPAVVGSGFELLLQATLTYCRVPTVTGLTEAAARAALTAADCAAGTLSKRRLRTKPVPKGASEKQRRKILRKNRRARRMNGKVVSQGSAPGTIIGQLPAAVSLTIGKLVKKKKKKE